MSAESQQFLPWLFPRLLGGVYFLAFFSLLVQVQGLYCSQGILPIAEYLTVLRQEAGSIAYRICPSLFWISSSDRAITGACILGTALSILLMAGGPPVPLLILLWLLYLSFSATGQEFLSFQWDALLLEAGFMTIFLPLAPSAPPLVVFTYCFFLFRFMFSSGAVKLLSGDSTWRELTALRFHYYTQPLPNRGGWYSHHLPPLVQKFSTFGTFVFELCVPLLAFGPEPVRLAGFVLFVFFQGLIFATGNYGFFNILTIVLTVPLLDDRLLRPYLNIPSAPTDPTAALAVTVIFAIFLFFNLCQLLALFYRPSWIRRLFIVLAPFDISNHYGLFAVMTTRRLEFVIEGSHNKEEWLTYEFRWKPGDLRTPPRQVAPHQPRLDWQMWFAALDPRTIEPWLANLVVRLLEGAPPVLRLLKNNPFPTAPPDYIRLSVYSYHFSTLAARRSEGVWWERTLVGHFPPLSLQQRE